MTAASHATPSAYFPAVLPVAVDPPSDRRWHGLARGPDGSLSTSDHGSVVGSTAGSFDTVVPVPGTREAELAKVLENTLRHVNLALVNEYGVLQRARDQRLVGHRRRDVQPLGVQEHPRGGVGRHCLPSDPSYLAWQVGRSLGKASGSSSWPTT